MKRPDAVKVLDFVASDYITGELSLRNVHGVPVVIHPGERVIVYVERPERRSNPERRIIVRGHATNYANMYNAEKVAELLRARDPRGEGWIGSLDNGGRRGVVK